MLKFMNSGFNVSVSFSSPFSNVWMMLEETSEEMLEVVTKPLANTMEEMELHVDAVVEPGTDSWEIMEKMEVIGGKGSKVGKGGNNLDPLPLMTSSDTLSAERAEARGQGWA